MPKKPQVAREEILRTALELVRSGGDGVLNARALAKALGCSTQPIFRNFTDMQALRAALLEEIHNRYLAFMEAYIAASAHPPYKASGLAYIAFRADGSWDLEKFGQCFRHAAGMNASYLGTTFISTAIFFV